MIPAKPLRAESAEFPALKSEQSPFSPLDDYMVHQTLDPIRVMWTSDPRTYERYWATVQDPDGELFIVCGGGFYPSLDTADAFALVVYQGQHTTVRAFRRLGDDRVNMRIGPIVPTIIEGLRTWRYVLEENEYGISFDFLWHDTKRQLFRGPTAYTAGGIGEVAVRTGFPGGRQLTGTSGFEGFGCAEGWVKIGDKRIELTKERHRGSRDRHWGVRDGVGPPSPRPPVTGGGRRGAHAGQWVEFKDWSIWGNRILYNFGDPRPDAGRIVKMERKFKFDPVTKMFQAGVIANLLESGEVKVLHLERLHRQTAHLRCGMYGGTPDKNIGHGMYVGEQVVEGETYDLSDPQVQLKLLGLDDHQCLVTCDGEITCGIFETVDPGLYEACRDGLPGFGFLE